MKTDQTNIVCSSRMLRPIACLSSRNIHECQRLADTALLTNPDPYTAASSFAESRIKEAKFLYGKVAPEYGESLSQVEAHQLETVFTIALIATGNSAGPYEEKVTALLLESQRAIRHGRALHNIAYECFQAFSEQSINKIPDVIISKLNGFANRQLISKYDPNTPVNLTFVFSGAREYLVGIVDERITKKIVDNAMQTMFADYYINIQKAC